MKSRFTRLILCVAVFVLALLLFRAGITELRTQTVRRQKEALQNAINQGISYCYVVEGRYPESLGYLRQHYGLKYDESRFYVDYQIFGANMRPDVAILERGT